MAEARLGVVIWPVQQHILGVLAKISFRTEGFEGPIMDAISIEPGAFYNRVPRCPKRTNQKTQIDPI
jgi:hypothetical protein